MGTVEVQDPQVVEGETEEVPQGGEGESTETQDEGWSINDVPLELRPHVEKAIKPFHSRTTKAERQASELSTKIQELESKASLSEKQERQLEVMKQDVFRLATDDNYRSSMRSRLGIKESPKNGSLPEGWDQPEAVTARKLLFDEFTKGFEETYGIKLSELPKVFNAASGFEARVMNDAQEEINATQKAVTDEGLPWSDEILDSCIQVIGRMKKSGKSISLRDAYDAIRKPFVEAEAKKVASTDTKIKTRLPFKPEGKGGDHKLTGDALLRNVINELGVPGSFND